MSIGSIYLGFELSLWGHLFITGLGRGQPFEKFTCTTFGVTACAGPVPIWQILFVPLICHPDSAKVGPRNAIAHQNFSE
jgi:hypothetical protein